MARSYPRDCSQLPCSLDFACNSFKLKDLAGSRRDRDAYVVCFLDFACDRGGGGGPWEKCFVSRCGNAVGRSNYEPPGRNESALNTSEKIRERIERSGKSQCQSIGRYLGPIVLPFLFRLNGSQP